MTPSQVHMTALLIAKGGSCGRLWRYRLEFLSERAYITVFLFRYDTLSDAGANYRSSISDHPHHRSRFKQSNPLSGYQGEGIGVLRIRVYDEIAKFRGVVVKRVVYLGLISVRYLGLKRVKHPSEEFDVISHKTLGISGEVLSTIWERNFVPPLWFDEDT
ncbi:hypothetical protein C8R48DRAFT_674466 [Suillus tomentosus]|nr:hypothetical protein C8R48DRAFT_674466 [Suillus tomentosus]